MSDIGEDQIHGANLGSLNAPSGIKLNGEIVVEWGGGGEIDPPVPDYPELGVTLYTLDRYQENGLTYLYIHETESPYARHILSIPDGTKIAVRLNLTNLFLTSSLGDKVTTATVPCRVALNQEAIVLDDTTINGLPLNRSRSLVDIMLLKRSS